MKINKKYIIFTLIFLTLITSLAIIYKNINSNEPKLENKVPTTNENNEITEIKEITPLIEFIYNYSDDKVMYNISDYIALIKINEITGVSNINRLTNEFIRFPYTYGKATILTTLKGNISEKVINFTRTGGKIPYEEFIKGEVDPIKIDTTSSKGVIIDYRFDNDIELELGKTYLVYMIKNKDFNIDNEYSIIGFQYGLREVQGDDIKNLSNIKVKNNETLKWENLLDVLNNKD